MFQVLGYNSEKCIMSMSVIEDVLEAEHLKECLKLRFKDFDFIIWKLY